MSDDLSKYSCSFCNASAVQVRHLIKGINAFICDECIRSCQEVIDDTSAASQLTDGAVKPTLVPEFIVRHLDDYIVGQEDAKKILAVAVYNHYKRIGKKLDIDIQKSNVMLIGPSGCGKTAIVSALAKLFDVPFVTADATTITEAGYVGDDVDMILGRLVQQAGGDIGKAERGICYIDEFDKIARTESPSGRDVRGEGVQQALLKMIEGGVVTINPQGGKKGPQAPTQEINTQNILFIVGGAFTRLTDVKPNLSHIGLVEKQTKESSRKEITQKDVIKFGMIPELIGRLPVIARLEPLKPEQLIRILTEPKDSLIRQYKALFALDGIELEFTDGFLKAVADQATKEETGARSLRALLEKCLLDSMYAAPGQSVKRLVIDESHFNAAMSKGSNDKKNS